MSIDSQPTSLLEQLDSMQDQVIRDLDELDEKIMTLIKQCTSSPGLSVVGAEEELQEAA